MESPEPLLELTCRSPGRACAVGEESSEVRVVAELAPQPVKVRANTMADSLRTTPFNHPIARTWDQIDALVLANVETRA